MRTLGGVTSETADELYRKHAEGLTRYATVLVGPDRAPDVVADAVVGVLRRGRLSDIENARAYLYRAVHNAAIATTRRTRAERQREQAAVLADVVSSTQEVDLDVLQAVAALSPRQRSVTWLTYWEDMRPGQVADVLGISEGSVKRHLARARSAVRKALR